VERVLPPGYRILDGNLGGIIGVELKELSETSSVVFCMPVADPKKEIMTIRRLDTSDEISNIEYPISNDEVVYRGLFLKSNHLMDADIWVHPFEIRCSVFCSSIFFLTLNMRIVSKVILPRGQNHLSLNRLVPANPGIVFPLNSSVSRQIGILSRIVEFASVRLSTCNNLHNNYFDYVCPFYP